MTTTPSTNDLTRQQLEELDALLQRMLTAPTVGDDSKPRWLPVDVPPPMPLEEPVADGWRVDRPTPAPVRPPHMTIAAEAPPVPEPEPVVMLSTAPPAEEPYLPPPIARLPANLLTNYAPAHDDDRVNPADVTEDDLPTLGGPRLPMVPMTPSVLFNPPKAVTIPVEVPPAVLPQFGKLDIGELSQPTAPVELPPAPPPQPLNRSTEAPSDSLPAVMWPLYAVNWVAEECLRVFGGDSLTKPTAKWSMGVAGLLMIASAAAWTAYGFGIVAK
ncbi:hypothetical protein [Limnoglobus roseus]|uniref:Uncharacterized protein n=1 Tax=Limnoglobus roseus TaxID=2598579 RepID=A0A5C1AA08_9BACT|nr:hypothetical protein [Limnoglobus roseus]QEL16219.1 hypothetical protein PX52LOC_03159 [Limnoglobus roseus]